MPTQTDPGISHIYPGSGLGRSVAGPSSRLGTPFVHGFLSVSQDLATVFARWAGTGRERRLRERTIRDLSALDDAALKDIGMSRSEIASVATNCTGRRRGRFGLD